MKILYFAWLRERLDRGEEEVSPPADVKTVADLIGWLRGRDEAADLALQRPEIIRAAVDAKIVEHDASISGARVVALFPPMTGG
jgi:molybdopterin synthase sulfur carrier subunit